MSILTTMIHRSIVLLQTQTKNIWIFLQHEKFTSGLQLSKKPANGETTTATTTSKSPAKTPTKTLKSPSGGTSRSGESRTTDGVKQPQAKSVDGHKAEDRIGGERQQWKCDAVSEIVWAYFSICCALLVPNMKCAFHILSLKYRNIH